MLAVLPIVGIDCARDVSSRLMVGLLGAVGVIAALGFAVDWIGRRGVSSLAVGKFSLSSFALIAAVFGFGGVAIAAAGIAKILFFLFIVALPLKID